MDIYLSVIICTHNPKKEYISRVLKALSLQTLSTNYWEVIIIDNASKQSLSSVIDLSWHPDGRHVREDELGLTAARIRGIKEAKGDVITFVDDDNVLAADYLEKALDIAKSYPMLGAWGAGSIEGEFETEPSDSIRPYLSDIAVGVAQKDEWSNAIQDNHALPCGAGMCVRVAVAHAYVEVVETENFRKLLDRRGVSLASCGDSDLAMTACDLKMGTARLTSLRLVHLIPSFRLTQDYFIRLHEGFGYSTVMLRFMRKLPVYPRTLPKRVFLFLKSLKKDDFSRRLMLAWRTGEQKAWRQIKTFQ